MRAYECDICGKLYTINNTLEERMNDPSLEIQFRNKTFCGVTKINTGKLWDNGQIIHSEDLDICPECVKALSNFIKERKDINVPG